ncbi:hypothetical protein EJ06DRAFT_531484 [Trichodelitschia bisporula]|uniref:DUF1742-domain-containing protein n=1 Tax=Trichodelitschia bisporula TaxID=703511 RepID=A0A6G1HT33_9PEZI|nr:hypothetical protein EJ06DRAFT_531484 [Trichodelitschia bisporula]
MLGLLQAVNQRSDHTRQQGTAPSRLTAHLPCTRLLNYISAKDFFYICPGHLKDRGFCTPDTAEVAAVAAKRKTAEEEAALKAEVERVKKEYEEKRKAKAKDGKSKAETDGEKEVKNAGETSTAADAAKPQDSAKHSANPDDDGPRIFTLSKSFYQQRVDRLRAAELARRNRERLKNPSLFPSVPTGGP